MLARLKNLLSPPKPQPITPPQHTATRWLVLQQGDNPSTDYYIRPHVAASGLPTQYRHIDQDSPQPADLQPGTQVIIVRYLTPAWAKALHKNRAQLAGVIYFMDDDLLNPYSWKTLPASYSKKLNTYCWQMRRHIYTLADTYWGSTPALCQKYSTLNMQYQPPQALIDDGMPETAAIPQQGPVQIFYHGSASHHAESVWLLPVMQAVLASCPRVHFEIIGDHEVNRLYRKLPRTRILHPMNWHNYLAHCRNMQGHIGLVPLLPGAFNETRSHIKMYDIARCRAVGLYAQSTPYDSAPHDLACLPMRPEVWISRISALCA